MFRNGQTKGGDCKNVYTEGDGKFKFCLIKWRNHSVLTWQVVTAVVFIVVTSCYNVCCISHWILMYTLSFSPSENSSSQNHYNTYITLSGKAIFHLAVPEVFQVAPLADFSSLCLLWFWHTWGMQHSLCSCPSITCWINHSQLITFQ